MRHPAHADVGLVVKRPVRNQNALVLEPAQVGEVLDLKARRAPLRCTSSGQPVANEEDDRVAVEPIGDERVLVQGICGTQFKSLPEVAAYCGHESCAFQGRRCNA